MWTWDTEQQQALAAAKNMLQSSALLVHYDSSKLLYLACDASPYGIGAVLPHENGGWVRKTYRICFKDFVTC